MLRKIEETKKRRKKTAVLFLLAGLLAAGILFYLVQEVQAASEEGTGSISAEASAVSEKEVQAAPKEDYGQMQAEASAERTGEGEAAEDYESLQEEAPAVPEAEPTPESKPTQTPEVDFSNELLEELELDEVEELLDSLSPGNDFSLKKAMGQLMSGEIPLTAENIIRLVREGVFGQLAAKKQLLAQILLILLAAAVFSNFSRAFEKTMMGEACFYCAYLLLFILLTGAFFDLSKGLGETLDQILLLMKAVAPAYCLALMASSGATTASLFYEMILLLILAVTAVVTSIVLPAINLYVLLQLVNHLSREDILSKLADLLRLLAEWLLKTMLGLLVGFQIIQRLVGPVLDTLKRTAIGKTASAIPGIGNAVNSVTEVILTSAVLIRNSLGAAFLVGFFLFAAAPLLGLAVNGFLFKLLAALIQPVSDRRMVECVNTVGEGCLLLMKTLFTVEVLCMLTLVILAGGG